MRYDETPSERYTVDEHPLPPPPRPPVGKGVVLGVLSAALVLGVTGLVMIEMGQNNENEEPIAVQTPAIPEAPSEDFAAAPVEEPVPERSPADQLRDAQAQVESLQTELAAHDAELASLKKEIDQRDVADADARDRARARQASIQHEIQGLRDALKEAQDERDALRSGLKEALAEVDAQVEQNTKLRYTAVAYKEASTENLWAAFTNNAKVRICDRGTHKRREDCDEQLDAFFTADQQATFTTCVNSAQAVPMLWLAEDGAEIPQHARRIDAHDRERSDAWYVVYCDPTLPEGAVAKDITEETPQIFASNR